MVCLGSQRFTRSSVYLGNCTACVRIPSLFAAFGDVDAVMHAIMPGTVVTDHAFEHSRRVVHRGDVDELALSL